jgi:hypothetical protein
VHQLERRAGVENPRIARVTSAADERPMAERWSQPLAPGPDHPADLVERPGQIGVERGPPFAFALQQRVESGVDASGDRGQARRGARSSLARATRWASRSTSTSVPSNSRRIWSSSSSAWA